MSACIHQRVCKHFGENEILECALEEVCKYHSQSYSDGDDELSRPGPLKAPLKKRVSAKENTEVLETFKKAKLYISQHEDDLDDNQRAALAGFKGKHYSSLSDEQRNQLIEIAAYLRRG